MRRPAKGMANRVGSSGDREGKYKIAVIVLSVTAVLFFFLYWRAARENGRLLEALGGNAGGSLSAKADALREQHPDEAKRIEAAVRQMYADGKSVAEIQQWIADEKVRVREQAR